jgi:hypothetical protein
VGDIASCRFAQGACAVSSSALWHRNKDAVIQNCVTRVSKASYDDMEESVLYSRSHENGRNEGSGNAIGRKRRREGMRA